MHAEPADRDHSVRFELSMQRNTANRLGDIGLNLPCDPDRWLAFVRRGDVAHYGVGQQNCQARRKKMPA